MQLKNLQVQRHQIHASRSLAPILTRHPLFWPNKAQRPGSMECGLFQYFRLVDVSPQLQISSQSYAQDAKWSSKRNFHGSSSSTKQSASNGMTADIAASDGESCYLATPCHDLDFPRCALELDRSCPCFAAGEPMAGGQPMRSMSTFLSNDLCSHQTDLTLYSLML